MTLPRTVPGVEARDGRFPGPSLIPALTAIQRDHGWLPREELLTLSREWKRPLYEIEGVMSFYPHFKTSPPKKIDLAVCHDLSCWLNDAEPQIAELKARYGDDVEVHVHEVSCLGRCDIAPAVAVQEQPANIGRVHEMVEAARADKLDVVTAKRTGDAYPNDPYASKSERYGVLRRVLAGEISHETIVQTLKDSGLRGMGGAGFPTGTKWGLVAAQPNLPKYAIVNADESEPGTFKDRQVMAEQPHLVLEGLLLGMVVTGAEEGWVFIRHEYAPEEHVLEAELDYLQEQNLIGPDVLGTGRKLLVDIFTSPGGYILGEESALIEAMEGHRGEPRNKPPFPGVYGLWGKPTLMNSVETFAHVPVILDRGADWWKAQGKNSATGLKFFSVSGAVKDPAVYCVPAGTTVRELIDVAGGMKDGSEVQAFQPGGASTNFLGPDALDTPLDWKPLQDAGSALGAGAMAIIDQHTDLLAAATNVLRFFRNESCGKCVPCRVGSDKAHTILTDLLERGGGPADVDYRITDLEETLRLTSICGLGQVALGPVASVLALYGQAEAPSAVEQVKNTPSSAEQV
ncbi:MAG: NAD(P)H-dependent oxidoreductase subunit E [Solirubrobacterales bacterium]|nr:NAD(P)H-dependent oxidoreductase subunit E [Solirubrobacterales bacterium]